jgi:hypothetical protein
MSLSFKKGGKKGVWCKCNEPFTLLTLSWAGEGLKCVRCNKEYSKGDVEKKIKKKAEKKARKASESEPKGRSKAKDIGEDAEGLEEEDDEGGEQTKEALATAEGRDVVVNYRGNFVLGKLVEVADDGSAVMTVATNVKVDSADIIGEDHSDYEEAIVQAKYREDSRDATSLSDFLKARGGEQQVVSHFTRQGSMVQQRVSSLSRRYVGQSKKEPGLRKHLMAMSKAVSFRRNPS